MKSIHFCLKSAATLAALSLSFATMAGALNIAQEPLGTGSGNTVKPNLWFVIDNSGSMDWTYLPDWVDDSICQKNIATLSDGTYSCNPGEVPYMASGFNRAYYNPAIQYKAPLKSDNTPYPNVDPTKAPGEPFIKSNPTVKSSDSNCFKSSGTAASKDNYCDLTTQFPRKRYCTTTSYTDCKENTNTEITATGRPYAYPDSTYAYSQVRYGAPYYYVMTGTPRWCNGNGSNLNTADCSGSKWTKGSYIYPQFAGLATAIAGVGATTTIRIDKAGERNGTKPGQVTRVDIKSGTTTIATLFSGSIKVFGADSKTNRNNLAVALVSAMTNSNYVAVQTTICGASSANDCKPVVKITAPWNVAVGTDNAYYNGKTITLSLVDSTNLSFTSNPATFAGGVNAQASNPGVKFEKVTLDGITSNGFALDPSTGKTYTSREDCTVSASGCTYDQELKNFANWYSYYRSRMLMMKSSLSLALENISDTQPSSGFRIGFTTINSDTDNDVPIKPFDINQRKKILDKLFAIPPGGSTPLRSALSRAGDMFGKKISSLGNPIEYSCQPNFTFLASDGYWNDDPYVGNNLGDVDASSEYPYKDTFGATNSLADIARHFYKTDLRPDMKDDVPAIKGSDEIPAGNDSMYQHMKTFTMGLGIDGTLAYDPAYSSGSSSTFEGIKTGSIKWPKPVKDEPTAIDDLWHAAVNGHGLYFSAATPNEVVSGLETTLKKAGEKTGSAAAAATSNLEPVAGDNYAYVASYRTILWDGELEAKEINLSTGELSTAATWAARAKLDDLAFGGGRKLYTAYPSGSVYQQMDLTWSNIVARGYQAYFAPRQISYCGPLAADVATKCPGATDNNLFDYLIGLPDATNMPNSYRERAYTAGSETGTHVLGDIVSTQPVYVKKPVFGYSIDTEDPGYLAFKSEKNDRTGMVYVSANDGFLHAFNAADGKEEWAYAPSGVLSKLWKLADKSYAHTYFVDGPLTVGDINDGGWKTILVGGMGGGGKNYFALNVNNPTDPKLLWEFTDADMGLTYGNPVITKRASDNKWVVLVTSGYNNHASNQPTDCATTKNCGLGGNGVGYLYVLDAATGTVLNKIPTSSGSAIDSSGLAKIANWVDDAFVNNKTQYVYGGDLNGDLWRFDITNGGVFKLASLGQPITTRPELAEVKGGRRAVFFGTGQFLQTADRNTLATQAIYGIKDDDKLISSAALVPRSFIPAGAGRSIAEGATIDWANDDGWYLPLDPGERVNVDPKIQLGTLVIPSNVPDADAAGNSCSVGGYGWINFIDFAKGSYVKNDTSNAGKLSSIMSAKALVVGVNIVQLPDGKVVAITTTADNKHPVAEVPLGTENIKPRRVSWRELTNN